MSLIKIAGSFEKSKEELDRIGMTVNNKDKMNRLMRSNILEIIKIFSKQGHSGFSADYAIDIIQKLLKQKPISPLTGEDSEWEDISEISGCKHGKKLYQNKRLYSVFKDETGKAWDNDKKSKEKYYITFPYTQREK